jgi:hypothetical protein
MEVYCAGQLLWRTQLNLNIFDIVSENNTQLK